MENLETAAFADGSWYGCCVCNFTYRHLSATIDFVGQQICSEEVTCQTGFRVPAAIPGNILAAITAVNVVTQRQVKVSKVEKL